MINEIKKRIAPAETAPTADQGRENAHESAPVVSLDKFKEKLSEAVTPTPVTYAPTILTTESEKTVRAIEQILSDDLLDCYQTMLPADREKFKVKGEETVSKLNLLMSKTVIKAKEVLKLIMIWLKMIPGVNKYFLEQESKIKTDKIIELHKRRHQ